ncbi:MAG: MATE family efflux transporter [Pseudomonadota bacterium]
MSETFQRKSLFKITFPLFVYAILSVAVTFADTALLANYSDNLAASVSLANQILGVAYDLSALLSVGALVLISQHLGRNEIEAARSIALIGMAAGMLLGLAIASVLILGAPFFANWVNVPAEVYRDVLAYIYIIALAMVFHGVIMSAQAALTGFGMTLVILIVGVVANVVYLGLEYTLIYGAFGFPELGVYGAAWSTVIVRGGTIVLLIYFLRRRLGLSFRTKPEAFWAKTRRILNISYPSVAENLAYNLYQLTVVSLIAVLGVSSVLTRSYALTITQLIMIITLVITHGNQVLVGYDRGAEDYEAAFRRAQHTAVITGALAMLASWCLYLNADFLIKLLTEDQAVIGAISAILFLQIFVTPLNTVNLLIFNSLKACGDVNRPVLINLGLTFGIALPLAYVAVAVWELGVVGLWYVYIVEEGLKAAAMFTLWRSRTWQRYEVMEGSAPKL